MYDLFISHASEDKDSFVRPLAHLLIQNGIRVWYDEFALKPGDSLSESIDSGLSKAKYGLVILSKAFITKPWTKRELRGLVSAEISGRSRIIPVWHEITRHELVKFSPTLADILALNTNIGIERIVSEIESVVTSRKRSRRAGFLHGCHFVSYEAGLLSLPKRFLPIPTKFTAERYVLCTSPFEAQFVICYPKNIYLSLANRLLRASPQSELEEGIRRSLLGGSHETGLTEGGELCIPKAISRAHSWRRTSSLVMLGMGDRFEIWKQSDWYKEKRKIVKLLSKDYGGLPGLEGIAL